MAISARSRFSSKMRNWPKFRGLYLSGVKVSENFTYHIVTPYHMALKSAQKINNSFYRLSQIQLRLVDSYKKLVLSVLIVCVGQMATVTTVCDDMFLSFLFVKYSVVVSSAVKCNSAVYVCL